MRRMIVVASSVGALALGGVATAAPSIAAPKAPATAQASCTADGGDPSGFTGPATQRTVHVTYGGRTLTVELRSGKHGSTQYAWSRISNARKGDRVWIDISQDSGATHKLCGPTDSPGTGQHWTHGFRTSSSAALVMRACGGIAKPGGWWANCTTWW